MGLSSVVDNEDNWLRDGREEGNYCVYEWLLELLICALAFILFREVVEPNVVEGVVVDC